MHICCSSELKAKLWLVDSAETETANANTKPAWRILRVKDAFIFGSHWHRVAGPLFDGTNMRLTAHSDCDDCHDSSRPCDDGHIAASAGNRSPPEPRWEGVNTSFPLMTWRGSSASRGCVLGTSRMRNALGLILGSVVAAVMIAGGWLFATSLRAAAKKSRSLPRVAKFAGDAAVPVSTSISSVPAEVPSDFQSSKPLPLLAAK